VLAHIGPVALAVTSSLNISFLRKPQPTGVEAEATFLKLGRKLAVVDVRLRSDGAPDLIAQAVVTYAIPSDRGSASS
jgi:acyl-coenzyme A thioesterase PaaI-like protein